jgi:hypothetical protein
MQSMASEIDEGRLARNMIEVHGVQAAVVARENARGAALAGQGVQARSWIRVLGIIQRRRAQAATPHQSELPTANSTKG